jgi:nitrogen-specific signal transduction histidine kinase
MIDASTMKALLDSLTDPLLFTDTEHVIRYMNKAAAKHYSDGERLLGTSLLDCHIDSSRRVIVEVLAKFHAGCEERLISENEEKRSFMRAVRHADGAVIGYYERYEKRSDA